MPKILFICAYQLLYIVEPQQFADKSSEVKAMVFLVLMYGCESWIIKKAEH